MCDSGRIPSILALLLVAAASLQSCAAPRNPAATLERRLKAALRDPDPELRASAANFLGEHGGAAQVEWVAPLTRDESSAVRAEAIRALSCMSGADDAAAAAAQPLLIAALHDGVTNCRQAAALALQNCSGAGVVDALRMALGDPAGDVRLAAGLSLAHLHASIDRRDARALLQPWADGSRERQRALLLDLVNDPGDRDVLGPLIESRDPRVRDLALRAQSRLDAAARGQANPEPSSDRAKQDRYDRENDEAARKLRRADWTEVRREELDAALRRARLVLCGEFHATGGPLRATQVDLLRAWSRGDGHDEALGYEPSVRTAQQPVLDAASALGLTLMSVESGSERWVPLARHAERDDEAAAEIESWLAAGPGRRLFVIRGESHVLPDGYLVQKLQTRPLILLCGSGPSRIPLEALAGIPDPRGRVFRLGGSKRIFVVGMFADERPGIPGDAKLRTALER